MSNHGKYALGFAFGIVNRELNLQWYGSPVEVLGALAAESISFAEAYRHRKSEVTYAMTFQKQPLFRWHGGPHSAALVELLSFLDERNLVAAAHAIGHDPLLLSPETDGSHVPILKAVLAGDSDAIALLTPDPTCANLRGQFDLTPLHWAATFGNAAAVSLLLSRGADPTLQSWFLLTPAEQAHLNGQRSIARLLGCPRLPFTNRGRARLVLSRMFEQ